MVHMELPHLNVITKCDIADTDHIERVLETEGAQMILAMDKSQAATKMRKFTSAIGSVIDDYMMVGFVTLDISKEFSIEQLVARTDLITQYGKLYQYFSSTQSSIRWNIYIYIYIYHISD